MDRFRIQLLLAFAMMSTSLPIAATTHGPDDAEVSSPQVTQDSSQHNRRLTRRNNPKRHRMPSREYMEYFYDGNGITITAPERYTRIEISIMEENSMHEISGTLSVENGYYIETGTLYGSYTITCATEDGSGFSGIMTNN